MSNPLPRATVLMRSKNSDWVIAQALAALFAQEYTNFELFVVDSGSTDSTLEIVGQYPCRLKQIPPSAYYPGAVMNDAIAEITTELIVFVNSDCVMLSPHSLTHLVKAFSDPHTVAAFGRQLPRPEADPWVRRDYAIAFPETGAAPDWMTLSLPIAAIRRSVWEKHPFYTAAWGSEDTEWGLWAREHSGGNVVYVPEAVAMHSHNYTFRQLYGRRFIEGEADAFIYRRQETVQNLVQRTLLSGVRDAVWHLRHRDGLSATMSALPRRAVYHWAYWRGHRHGERRIATHDTDTSIGQKVVLSRHESRRDFSSDSQNTGRVA
ncbi:MAG: glycosyltransferase [Armatimonadaceae bacterium]